MNRLTVLLESDIDAIHGTSLAILRDVGVHAPHDTVLARLAEQGARVDFGKQTVRFPETLVEDAIRRAGKRYELFGRDGSHRVRFGYGDFVFPSTEGQTRLVEDDGRVRRLATRKDVRDAIRVADALEHIDWLGGFVLPGDVPPAVQDVSVTLELLKGSAKPQHVFYAAERSFRFALRMCEAVSGGAEAHRRRPMIAGFVEPISPLHFSPDSLGVLVACVTAGLPISFGPMVQTGSTGPGTLAGTIALENAEILAAVAIAQAVAPGIPVGYGCSCHTADLRTMMISFGAPEQSLFGIANTQISRRYGFPSLFNTGLTDAKRVDAQLGVEKGVSLIVGMLAGLETCGPMGIVGADQGASLEQLVVDDEIIAYVKRIMRGFSVSPETLALDVVRRVGIGGNFLTEDHTLDHVGAEVCVLPGFDRRHYDGWSADGCTSMVERARERLGRILATHHPQPLDARLSAELDRIFEEAAGA